MKLLNDLDKKPYQLYTIEHGIERIRIKVPLKEAAAFEAAFAEAIDLRNTSTANLLSLVNKFSGTLRSK